MVAPMGSINLPAGRQRSDDRLKMAVRTSTPVQAGLPSGVQGGFQHLPATGTNLRQCAESDDQRKATKPISALFPMPHGSSPRAYGRLLARASVPSGYTERCDRRPGSLPDNGALRWGAEISFQTALLPVLKTSHLEIILYLLAIEGDQDMILSAASRGQISRIIFRGSRDRLVV